MTQEELQAIRSLWRIDDPQHTKNTERGEAILINQLLDEIERQAKEIEQNERDFITLEKSYESLIEALTFIRVIKTRDHNNPLQRLQYIDNIACQALDGKVPADAYEDDENERLRGALEWIKKHVESRLENVKDDRRKEIETYTDHQDKRKRERSIRVQNALRNDMSSLRQVQTVVQRALEGTE